MQKFFKLFVIPNWLLCFGMFLATFAAGMTLPLLYLTVSKILDLLLTKNLVDFYLYSLYIFLCVCLWGGSSLVLLFFSKIYMLKITYQIRQIIIAKTLQQNILSFRDYGNMLSWFSNDATTIKRAALLFPHLFTHSIMIVTLIALALYTNLLSGSLILTFALTNFLVVFLIRGLLGRIGLSVSKIQALKTIKLSNLLEGQSIFLFSKQLPNFKNVAAKILEFFEKKELKKYNGQHFFDELITFISRLFNVIQILIAGWMVYAQIMPLSALLSILFLYQPLYSWTQILHANLVTFWNSTKLIQKFDIYESTTHPKYLPSFEKINLKNVTIILGEKDEKILENINFTFKQRQKYAIIGRSGVGKSVLVQLILKSITPQKGEVTYNDFDYSLLTPQHLLTKISFVSTEFGIFTASLRDNVTLFNEDIEDTKIKPLLRLFNLEHFTLDQEISEHNVSKGEMQRIALVRAYLEGKDFFIFDEAFSNLDTKNQIFAENVFLKDSKKTVINVTHHLQHKDFYHDIIDLGQ